MTTTLTVHATEQSTYVINVAFKDEDDSPVTPSSAYWTLTDPAGNVVNERADEEITALASTKDIVLGGADLALEGYSSYTRHFLVYGAYNSSLGSGLAFKALAVFDIDPLVAVET